MSGVRKIASAAFKLAGASRPLERAPVVATLPDEGPASGAEDVYKQAYLDGFSAGEEDGRKEAERQAQDALGRLERAIADADAARERWQESMREALGQFSLVTASQQDAIERLAAQVAEISVSRIVGRMHAEGRAVEAACRETLRELEIESAQIRVSPSDLETLGELPPGVDLVPDPSLEPGSCLLRSPLGDVDAGLSSQLARLREALANALVGDS